MPARKPRPPDEAPRGRPAGIKITIKPMSKEEIAKARQMVAKANKDRRKSAKGKGAD